MNQTKIKQIQVRARIDSLEKMVKLQFLIYSFTRDIHLTPGDFSLLTHIAMNGYDRRSTPEDLVSKKVFLHKQSVRNTRNKLVSMGILIEPKKHHFELNPELRIESSGQFLIDFKAVNI